MAAAATIPRGKIGPNAIIQTIAALEERYAPPQLRAILARGGAAELIDRPPAEMIDEQQFHSLAQLLVDQLGARAAGQVLRRAGQRTATYLLHYRIPRPAQWALRALPAGLSLRLLLPAVAQHAWTFAGSGTFSFAAGRAAQLSIASPALYDAPELAAAVCSFYRGTFDHLLRTLVDRRVSLWETACQGRGDDACVYQITREAT